MNAIRTFAIVVLCLVLAVGAAGFFYQQGWVDPFLPQNLRFNHPAGDPGALAQQNSTNAAAPIPTTSVTNGPIPYNYTPAPAPTRFIGGGPFIFNLPAVKHGVTHIDNLDVYGANDIIGAYSVHGMIPYTLDKNIFNGVPVLEDQTKLDAQTETTIVCQAVSRDRFLPKTDPQTGQPVKASVNVTWDQYPDGTKVATSVTGYWPRADVEIRFDYRPDVLLQDCTPLLPLTKAVDNSGFLQGLFGRNAIAQTQINNLTTGILEARRQSINGGPGKEPIFSVARRHIETGSIAEVMKAFLAGGYQLAQGAKIDVKIKWYAPMEQQPSY